ncbi:MAG: DUF433 domain-containing protein [Cyanobacteria bacterium J06623_4]
MDIAPHISVDAGIHHGAPVITGTRVPVFLILGSLAGGMDKDAVIREYALTKAQLEAALAYAAELVQHTQVTALTA